MGKPARLFEKGHPDEERTREGRLAFNANVKPEEMGFNASALVGKKKLKG